MAIGTALFIASLVSTGLSIQKQQEGVEAQKEARDVQSANQSISAARRTRNEIRRARVRRAQILQQSENTGVGTGSGVEGAIGSIASRISSAQATLSQGKKASQRISDSLQTAADANFQSQLFSQSADIFSQAAFRFGGS